MEQEKAFDDLQSAGETLLNSPLPPPLYKVRHQRVTACRDRTNELMLITKTIQYRQKVSIFVIIVSLFVILVEWPSKMQNLVEMG